MYWTPFREASVRDDSDTVAPSLRLMRESEVVMTIITIKIPEKVFASDMCGS